MPKWKTHILNEETQSPLCNTRVGDIWDWSRKTRSITCLKCRKKIKRETPKDTIPPKYIQPLFPMDAFWGPSEKPWSPFRLK